MEIKKTELHPEGDKETTLYPKTSIDQVDGLTEELEDIRDDISEHIQVTPQSVNNVLSFDENFEVNLTDDKVEISLLYQESVSSVNGKTGAVVIDATDVKLTTNQQTVQANFIRIDESLDNKLDKISTSGTRRVYGITTEGNQAEYILSQAPNNQTIAQRNADGNIKTNTPVYFDDCANKKYVDDHIGGGGKIYKHYIYVDDTDTGYYYITLYSSSITPIDSFSDLIEFVDKLLGCMVYSSAGENGAFNSPIVEVTSSTSPLSMLIKCGFTYSEHGTASNISFNVKPTTEMSDDVVEM